MVDPTSVKGIHRYILSGPTAPIFPPPETVWKSAEEVYWLIKETDKAKEKARAAAREELIKGITGYINWDKM